MKLFLGAIQWMAFFIAASIAVPIAIAQAFELNQVQSAELIQSTFFSLGLVAMVQCLCGHMLPINESPAGLWWGVYTLYAGMTGTIFATYPETLQALQGALIFSAAFFFIFSLFKIINWLASLFTPVVTGIYLLLLVVQLSQPIMKGLMGIGYRGNQVDGLVFCLSILIIVITFMISRSKWHYLRQFSVLFALAGGWLLFALLGLAKPVRIPEQIIEFPKLFPFGMPVFDSGLLVTSFFITILLIVNMLASIRIVESSVKAFGELRERKRARPAGFVAAFGHLLSGLIGAIAPVPISGAAGFIQTTKIPSRKPFLLGSLLIVLISLFPLLMSFFSALPSPVGLAVNFVVFSSMIGIAMSEFDQYEKEDIPRIRFVLGIAVLAGVGAMFVPQGALKGMHPVLISLLSNGLVLGTLIAIVVDQVLLRKKKKSDNLVSAS